MAARFSEADLVDRSRSFTMDAERRYPLSLLDDPSSVHQLYDDAVANRWDPEALFEHDVLGSEAGQPARAAAALVWSHRCWLEYRGIRESETALVRACLEVDCEASVKYFLANRGSRKALASEAAWLAATRLGGYTSAAPESAIGSLLADDVARRGLHSGMDADAFIGGQLLVGDLADLAVLSEMRAATTEPTLLELLDRVRADSKRHVAFDLQYLRERMAGAKEERLRRIVACVTPAVERELAGFRVPWWLPDDRWTRRICEAYQESAAAGLGGVSRQPLESAVRAALASAVAALAELGAEIADTDLETRRAPVR